MCFVRCGASDSEILAASDSPSRIRRAFLAPHSAFCGVSASSARVVRSRAGPHRPDPACAVLRPPRGLPCPSRCARFASDSVPIRAPFRIGTKPTKPAPRLGFPRIGTVPIRSPFQFRFFVANRNRFYDSFQGLHTRTASPESQTGQGFAPGPLLFPATFKTAHSDNGSASIFVHFRPKINQS